MNIKSYTHYNEESYKQTEEYKNAEEANNQALNNASRNNIIKSFLNYNKEKNQITYTYNKYDVIHANKDFAELNNKSKGVHLNTVFSRIEKQ